jgi:hypothetical protein
MNKIFASRRISLAILSLALLAAVHTACSEDAPVGSDGTSPLKDRPCFDFADHLHTASLTSTPGNANAVVAADGLAYVADGVEGLRVVDTSDPRSPVLRGGLTEADAAWDVALAHGYAYVTFGSAGLAVVDCGDPDTPVVVGRVDTPGGARGLAVLDSIAYVADDVIGLMLFNVGDPSAPDPMGVDNTPGRAVDVAVSGALAYVADEIAGLRVVSVSDPDAPWLVNTVSLTDAGLGVALAGDHAYVAAGYAGLQIVDISTPGQEAIVGSFDTSRRAMSVAIDGDFAFIAAEWAGMLVVDISDPEDPIEVNHVAPSVRTVGVSLDGGQAFVAELSGGFRVVEVPSPLPAPVLATMPTVLDETITHLDLDEESGIVYGAGHGTGLFGVRLGSSEFLHQGSRTLPADVGDLVVQDGLAYVAYDHGGAAIFDVSDPRYLTGVGSIPIAGRLVSMAVADSVVYFATGTSLFGVFELGNNNATTVALVSGQTTAVGLNGDFAYVASGNRQMHTVNIADPGAPVNTGVVVIEGSGEQVLVDGDYTYVITSANFSGAENGVAVYDSQYEAFVLPVTFMGLQREPVSAALSGSILYVAIGVAGVEAFDVADPANPVLLGSITSVNEALDVTVTGGAVIVADGSSGMFVTPAQACTP